MSLLLFAAGAPLGMFSLLIRQLISRWAISEKNIANEDNHVSVMNLLSLDAWMTLHICSLPRIAYHFGPIGGQETMFYWYKYKAFLSIAAASILFETAKISSTVALHPHETLQRCLDDWRLALTSKQTMALKVSNNCSLLHGNTLRYPLNESVYITLHPIFFQTYLSPLHDMVFEVYIANWRAMEMRGLEFNAENPVQAVYHDDSSRLLHVESGTLD